MGYTKMGEKSCNFTQYSERASVGFLRCQNEDALDDHSTSKSFLPLSLHFWKFILFRSPSWYISYKPLTTNKTLYMREI